MSKKSLKEIFIYSIPFLLVIIINTLVYNGSKVFTNHLFHYNASIFIDKYIPFLPIFITFYILAYVQWLIGFILVAKENEELYYQYTSAEIIAKFICLFFFLVFPTTMNRPDITGNSIFDLLTRFIYKMDDPVNLFPSIHCLESYLVFKGSLYLKKVPKSYKYITCVFSIMVFLSTIFVHQHVFIDIIGGIVVVEIGWFLAKKWKMGKYFEKLITKWK